MQKYGIISFAQLLSGYLFSEIKCPIPQVMYGKVESGGDVNYKETAKLKCDAGFIFSGTNLAEKDVTCGSDAIFSGLEPCVSKSSV